MKKPLVIYHAHCLDGFAAAWAATRPDDWRLADLHPASYGDEPPDVTDRDVLVVDFSYPRETLVAMHDVARSLHVYDHHATAAEALADLPFVTLDQNRSGAGLVWDEHVGTPRPWIIDYVEDRDLWRHALPLTHEVNAYLFLIDRTFVEWSWVLQNRTPASLKESGRMALKARELYVESVIESSARAIDKRIAVLNIPRWAISEVLHSACKKLGVPLAVGWTLSADRRCIYSVRGQGARHVAEHFGGGGHPLAAGFTTDSPLTDEQLLAAVTEP